MIKKGLLKISAIFLSTLLVFPMGTTLAAEQKPAQPASSTKKVLVDDQGVTGEKLELSPVSGSFKKGQKAAPLAVNFQKPKVLGRVRSRAAQIPSMYDLREQGRVTPVRSQGLNGSCWAFATYGSMESVLKHMGSNFDLSEKHLRNSHGFDWGPNDGGNRDISTAYLARGDGPISEKDDPYDPVISTSPANLNRVLDIDKVLYLPDVNNFQDTADIKKAIMDYGGVYTTINSSKYYENARTKSYYNPGGGSDDHAVTIVGWDDSFPKQSFNSRPNEDGAWICKNSWGSSYMEGGYYYVSYEDAFCGKSNAIFIPKKKDPNARIYQYDPFGATRSVGYNKKGFMGNVFTAKGKEKLHEVGLFSVSMMTDYKIYLVRHVSKTSQLAKERVEVASGTFRYPGYYTVNIKPVDLDEGESFAIIAEMNTEKSNYRFPLPIETQIEGYSSKASAKAGETYVSPDGEKWSDLTKEVANANGCIKAITTTGKIIDDGEKPDNPEEPEVKPDEVTDLKFREGTGGYIHVNEKGKVTPVITPSHLKNVRLKFYSSDIKTVKVTEDGIIVPQKVGQASIIVECRVSRGIVRARMTLEVIPKDLKYDFSDPIPVIGPNDELPEPEKPVGPDDTLIPDPPKPYEDPTVARNLNLIVPSKTLREGEEFNLAEKILVYPETAKPKFSFTVQNSSLATVSKEGVIHALRVGNTKVIVKTNNGLQKTMDLHVLPKYEKHPLELSKFTVSERKGGVFTLSFEAGQDGKGYTGPATVTTVAGNGTKNPVTVTSKVYFSQGKGSITYNGGQFGIWRTDFTSKIKLRDLEDSIQYQFSKSSSSPVFMVKGPKLAAQMSHDLRIGDIKVSERVAGIFQIGVAIQKDGKPYNGKVIVDTESEGTFRSDTADCKNGICTIKYTGGDFGVWKKSFHSVFKLEDTYREFSFESPNHTIKQK